MTSLSNRRNRLELVLVPVAAVVASISAKSFSRSSFDGILTLEANVCLPQIQK